MVHVDVRWGRVFALVKVSGALKVESDETKRIYHLAFALKVRWNA
jgi:hypothetical protein